MALVMCEKCGHQVSSSAVQCPGCQVVLQPAVNRAQSNGDSGMVSGYRPATILQYSHHLISVAQLMMLICTLLGAYAGWKAAPLLAFGRTISETDYVVAAVIGAVSGFFSVGWIAFLYIYLAQLSLCLLQIEKNTRR